MSPSGSDVLPLPTSRRSTRRASASWCGSTRELAQLSPTDGDIDNIRRSESSFETNDSSLDSPGITLRPKGQLWLPVALIGTTAEENGNSIRKRYEYSARHSENAKFCNFILDSLNSKVRNNSSSNQSLSKGSDSSLNSTFSDQNDYQFKRSRECVSARNAKVKSDEMNCRSRESSVESRRSFQDAPRCRPDVKKRSLSVGGITTSNIKRSRTVSTNSACSGVRRKKLSPEEKLLQDNKEYFKMEVLNVKLRSSGSLLNTNQYKETDQDEPIEKPIEKIIIKKVKTRGRRRRSRWTKANAGRKVAESVNAGPVPEEKEKSEVKINGIIRKKRLTELTQLCDEAESFMFGESTRQDNESSKQPTIEDSFCEDSSKKKDSSIVQKEGDEENSGSSISEMAEIKRRRKRRSHAEAFIHDNIDYYKFETPGSRLRYQGSFIDTKQEKTDFSFTPKDKRKGKSGEEPTDDDKVEVKLEPQEAKMEKKRNPTRPSEEVEKLLFSFESIPSMEPWYDVYKRQDEGMENYYPLLSDPSDQPFLLPYEMPKGVLSRVPEMSDYYKKKKKKLGNLFNHPRKSPRCHASTLAILSSLKKRKRRSGTNISMSSVLSESPHSEEKQEQKQEETEQVESEEILNFLREEEEPAEDEPLVFFEPLSDSEIKLSEKCEKIDANKCRKAKLESQSDAADGEDDVKLFCFEPNSYYGDMVIETGKKSGLSANVLTLIENFINYKTDDGEVDLISEFGGSSADGLDLRRKKKKARKINKTGWDNKKSRRRTGNKVNDSKVSSDGVSSKPKRIKTKLRPRDYGIDEDNIIVSSKRRLRNNEDDNRPMLRSRVEVSDRCTAFRRSHDGENSCESSEANSLERPPSVVHTKKAALPRHNSTARYGYANGRFGMKNRLSLSKRRKVMDYAWTTKRR